MNNYEGVFILRPALDKGALEKIIEEIGNSTRKHKGEVIELQQWGKRKLAYPIKKQTEGIYCIFQFKLLPETVKKLENTLKLNDGILRILIVRKKEK